MQDIHCILEIKFKNTIKKYKNFINKNFGWKKQDHDNGFGDICIFWEPISFLVLFMAVRRQKTVASVFKKAEIYKTFIAMKSEVTKIVWIQMVHS